MDGHGRMCSEFTDDRNKVKIQCSFPYSAGKREKRMPQKILCTGCNTILYDGFELESPLEIIQRNNGVCPKCGRKLGFDPDAIKIIPTSEARNLRR